MALKTTSVAMPSTQTTTGGGAVRSQAAVHQGVQQSPSRGGAGGSLTPGPGDSAPIWRCDVCGYATPVARNLRIHMTSEKHAHNVAILQQQQQQQQELHQFAASRSSHPINGGRNSTISSVDTSSRASGWPSGPHPLQVLGAPTTSNDFLRQTFDLMQLAGALFGSGGGGLGGGMHPMKQQPGLVHEPQRPTTTNYTTAQMIRGMPDSTTTRRVGSSWSSGTSSALFECETCPYRTNLRANFHLHCQTDKHLQRVGEALAMIERQRRESSERDVTIRDSPHNARWIDGSGMYDNVLDGKKRAVDTEAMDFRRPRVIFDDQRNGTDDNIREDDENCDDNPVYDDDDDDAESNRQRNYGKNLFVVTAVIRCFANI